MLNNDRTPAISRTRETGWGRFFKSFLGVIFCTGFMAHVMAQTLVSVVPANNATGVSPSTSVVFTFDTEMNTDPTTTVVMFYQMPSALVSVRSTWNASSRQLTCTPVTSFSAGKLIYWAISAEDVDGDSASGEGSFTVSASTPPPCTNLMNSFTIAKGIMYNQTSTGAPSLQTNNPFAFVACTTLSCDNSDATNVVLTSSGKSWTLMPTLPLHFSYTGVALAQSSLDSTYGSGPFTFNLQSSRGSAPYNLSLSSSLSQPNSPHLSNFAAAQNINPGQPFTLSWDPFVDGTAAETITVEIYGNVFATPGLGTPGALTGTAGSVILPAGTLQTNQNYQGAITFYRATLTTNSESVFLTYRSSVTEFTLSTFASTRTPSVVLTNAAKTSGALSFEVVSDPQQNLVVECNTNLQPAGWKSLLITNSATGRFLFKDPSLATNRTLFYRARPTP